MIRSDLHCGGWQGLILQAVHANTAWLRFAAPDRATQFAWIFVIAGIGAARAHAQEPQAGAVLANAVPQPRGGEGAPAPPPGEDVLRPTEHGVRFTPALARGFAGVWIRENVGDAVDMSADQNRGLAQAIADRMVRMSHERPRETEKFIEGVISTMIATDGGRKMTAEDAKRFSEAMQPVMGPSHEFLDGVGDDAARILDADQQKRMQKALNKRHKHLDRLGQRLERWSRGEFKDDERATLDDLFNPQAADDEPDSAKGPKEGKEGKTRVMPAVKQARMMARGEIDRLGPGEWQRFALMAKTSFKFTPEQSTRTDQLLGEYRAKASALMTPEWQRRLRENRIRSNVRWNLSGEPTAPWVFHLEREYDELTQTLRALQNELYGKVLALATEEQRSAVIVDLAAKAAEHGLMLTDADRALLLSALR